MDTANTVASTDDRERPTRLSARGILAGVVVGLAFEVMLLVLGTAIGLTAFAPRGAVAKELGIGFAAWVLLTLVVSGFVGGWVAAGAARAVRRRDGVLHGLVTWAIVMLVGLSLVGGVVRGAMRQLGNAIDSATANTQELAGRADQAASGAAIGTWGIFASMLLPLIAAVLGGVIAAARERRLLGMVSEPKVRRRRREPRVTVREPELPTRPVPST